MNALIRVIERLTGSVGIFAALLIVPLILATSYEVLARYLFGAPFKETLVATNTTEAGAIAARLRLQAKLDELNPAGGIVDPGDGSGKHANRSKKEKKAKKAGAVEKPNATGETPPNPEE